MSRNDGELVADGSSVEANGGLHAGGYRRQKHESVRPPEPTLDGKWEARLRALGQRLRKHEEEQEARENAEATAAAQSSSTGARRPVTQGVVKAHGSSKTGGKQASASSGASSLRKTPQTIGDEPATGSDSAAAASNAVDDAAEYFYTVDKWGHEIKQPITFEQFTRAMADAASKLTTDGSVDSIAIRSVDADGRLKPLAIDWGFDSDGYPFIIIGDRGSMPVVADGDTPETDTGLLLEQPGEGTSTDDGDDGPHVELEDVIECAGVIASMSTPAEIAKANAVRKNDAVLWRAANIAVGLLDDEHNDYDEIKGAAEAAIKMLAERD